jgi:hypothetical protein
MGFDGKPVEMYIKPDVGTFNQIIIVTPPGAPGNSPIKLPGDPMHAPGSPFVITGVTATLYQNGTSCANPTKWTVTIQYTGDTTGKTVDIYINDQNTGFALYIDTVDPTVTYIIPQQSYWNKPNSIRPIVFRIEETGNPTNTADSEERSIEGEPCF